MKLIKTTLLAVLILILCFGCANEDILDGETGTDAALGNTQSADETADAEQAPTLSGSLLIADYIDLGGSTELAAGFMKMHPDVTITVESIGLDIIADFQFTGDPTAYSVAQEAYQQQMRVRMMSGEDTPDIVNIGMLLNLEKSAESGILADLYPLWNNDPDIIGDDYFTNILQLCEYNGGLYAIPATFNVSSVHINKRITEPLGIDADAFDTINAKELLDMYLLALDSEVANSNLYYCYGDTSKDAFLNYFIADYFDLKTKTARFDTPEFIEYLEKSNGIFTKRTVYTRIIRGGDVFIFDSDAANAAFAMEGSTTFDDIDQDLFASPYSTAGIPLTTLDGELFAMPMLCYGIANGSSNKELAWEFIKYCILESNAAPYLEAEYSEDVEYGGREQVREFDGDRFNSFFPLNKNNFRKYFQSCYDWFIQEREVRNSPGRTNSAIISQYPEYEEYFTKEIAFEDAYATYASWAERASVLYPNIGEEFEIRDILTLYYDQGLIDAAECARRLQERAEIYFAE